MTSLGMKAYYRGETEEAMRNLMEGKDPVAVLNAMRVPRQFESEADVDYWFAHLDKAIERAENFRMDPARFYDALWVYETFELPYSGRNVTPYLKRIGKLVREKISKPALPHLTQPVEKRGGDKVRVAYVSRHMYAHNGARWVEGWIDNHADDIEVYVFNTSDRHDFVSDRIGHKVKFYQHLSGSIVQIARYIKDFGTVGCKHYGIPEFGGFDAIIHPAIGMAGQATQLASLNLAPVQMTAWGHPVTSGMDSVDYYLSSDLMEPENGQDHYSEELVRLPGSGLCYPRIEDGPTLGEVPLPDKYMFCAQNVMKLAPKWDFLFKECQLATGLPLVLVGGVSDAESEKVKTRMERAGIDVVWLPQMPRPVWLEVLGKATVSLDPPAWSGGNTTVEAIHFGTPVVALPGEFMRGRHSLCFLKQAGLERFIASNPEDYVSKVSDVVKTGERLPEGSAEPIFENKEPVRALDELLRTCAG